MTRMTARCDRRLSKAYEDAADVKNSSQQETAHFQDHKLCKSNNLDQEHKQRELLYRYFR
jgi:hypothetical protein